jgi:hypothetical protein
MTEYMYTDANGYGLRIVPSSDVPGMIQIEMPVLDVHVPADRLHDVIAGLLAMAAAAQGRTWTSQLPDFQAALTTMQTGTLIDGTEAQERLLHEYLPLLLALAEAYTGQDSLLWQQYRRVLDQRDTQRIIATEALTTIERRTAERDAATRRGTLQAAHTTRLIGENAALTTQRDQARAEANAAHAQLLVERGCIPVWQLDLIAAVAKYEDEHGHVHDGWTCLGKALEGVPARLRDLAKAHALNAQEEAK